MINIAVVTPWPPQHTGIGDYAFDLISELSKFDISIHVYTDCNNPQPLNNIKILQIKTCNLDKLRDYDLIIYQMGNNVNFHLYMLDLVREYGGIVYLHDMVLHHIMGWITWMQNDSESYFGLLEKWYGRNVSSMCNDLMKLGEMPWECEVVTEVPLFEELIQYADACIVHSEFAKKKVMDAFPDLNVYQILHVLKGMEIVEKKPVSEGEKVKIGVFGGIEKNKNIDVIINSLAGFKAHKSLWDAHIVGAVGDGCDDIPKLPVRLGIERSIFFHGRPESKKFNKMLSEMDIIVSLRYPTMGETSGIVARTMQMGIPIIVSDIGWYGELPGFVDKVSVYNMHNDISILLEKYIFDRKYLEKKKNEFVFYSKSKLDFSKIIGDFFNILMKEHQKKCSHGTIRSDKSIEMIAQTLFHLDLCEDFFLDNIVRKLNVVLTE
ncbi:MAG TPA: glycosyltransferase [Desulfobacteraceae bacterium]|nr:glycosyltransferase [Desulfobacteraceae bacterium]HPJ68630.1 glycosyltransferase [Desulfobacteraceae bacterium]HPQ27537.1 glycosyltransferase [Desulfobacteraceae bacterium]